MLGAKPPRSVCPVDLDEVAALQRAPRGQRRALGRGKYELPERAVVDDERAVPDFVEVRDRRADADGVAAGGFVLGERADGAQRGEHGQRRRRGRLRAGARRCERAREEHTDAQPPDADAQHARILACFPLAPPVAQRLPLDALVGAPGRDVRELVGPPARPGDDDAIHTIPAAHAERHRQFRLRQIARAALHSARLGRPVVEDADGRADRIAIGFGAGETEPQAPVPRRLIVAEQIRGPVVRRDQDVQIAVTIEVADGEPAPDLRLREVRRSRRPRPGRCRRPG